MKSKKYPLIDIFAGPGGLGEGFSSYTSERKKYKPFEISVSIERDEYAYETLLLRHFFKSFDSNDVPEMYYQYLNGELTKEDLYQNYSKNFELAKNRAFKISLGEESHDEVKKLIAKKLNKQKKWALIGGPPCQAYSLVGRSRMKGSPDFEADERHFLYKEYLKIIFDHKPPVFIMENVKGLLSAKVDGEPVINRIVSDLSSPQTAVSGKAGRLKYKLYSLSHEGEVDQETDPKHFIVKAENHGVPQARHRMFIIGVRSDIEYSPSTLIRSNPPSVKDVISDLPKIRSHISRQKDNAEEWVEAVCNINSLMKSNRVGLVGGIETELDLALRNIKKSRLKTNSKKYKKPKALEAWYYDEKLKSISCHESRGHMEGDLHRYLFCSLYAKKNKISPKIKDFPVQFLPKHKNINKAVQGKMFSDRFRVQVADRVATTITSHISKDGHYFIHYDPVQCRSLTVREAARLQTFPDNYHFEGPRTAKFHQVGNAVPPYLAAQIAVIIESVLDRVK